MPRVCLLNADHMASLPKGDLGDLVATLGSERLAEAAGAVAQRARRLGLGFDS
jgi:hypothetical protein